MAIALDAIGNFAAIGVTAGLDAAQGGKPPLTSVVIGPGHADDNSNLGGNAPHVALWDKKGSRIDQWHPHPDPKKNKDIVLEGQIFTIGLNNVQANGAEADPEYALLALEDNNALCIAALQITGNGDTWSWYGDIGKKCGAQWFHNDKAYGADEYQPACTWLSGPTNTHGYLYNGIGVHMPDFNSDSGLVKEYNDQPDAACKSTSRFKMYSNIDANAIIPFFKPPLAYKPDGSDVDLARVIDKPPAHPKRESKQRLHSRAKNNNDPSKLIVSEYEMHSAKEVCESVTAVGPDFVSIYEKIYCQMGTGHMWPLCDNSVKSNCFELDLFVLKDGNDNKPYTNVKQWKKK